MAYSNYSNTATTGSMLTGASTLAYTSPDLNVPYCLRDELASRATEKDIEAHRGITPDGGCTPITEEEARNCPKDWVRTREQAKYHYADAMITARNS